MKHLRGLNRDTLFWLMRREEEETPAVSWAFDWILLSFFSTCLSFFCILSSSFGISMSFIVIISFLVR